MRVDILQLTNLNVMSTKLKLAIVGSPLLASLFVATANAQVTTSTVNTAISQAKDDVSSVAATTITVVLGFVGLLIAGGWAWRFLKRHIGKRI